MISLTRRLSTLARQFSTATPKMSYPLTVQAITISKTGGPEVIEKHEIPFQVAPNHLVVKVQYLGVNFIDTYYREGIYKAPAFPFVIGEEASGVIVALPTDKSVLNDPDYKKRGYKIGSRVALNCLSSHAEYVSAPWKSLYIIPESVSTLTAVSALAQGLTAVTFMEEAYNVQKGDIIFIHTVAGGLGLLMTQLAKSRGATVIGTTSTPEKAALAKANGTDHVILYKSEDTVARVLELTNGEGVHAIFDGVGRDTFESDFIMIRRKGTIVTLGNASGAVLPFPPIQLAQKNVKLLRPTIANYTYTPAEALYYGNALFSLLANGTLKARIFKEYPFTAEGVRQAQIDLTSGKSTGKLVVKVSD
ncbi:hypothetical protein F4604DRAFT_1700434 [Suillus subluteus]|nr:hypothetical protein F4604DRAFT_1700434 [Suillus subluteus]